MEKYYWEGYCDALEKLGFLGAMALKGAMGGAQGPVTAQGPAGPGLGQKVWGALGGAAQGGVNFAKGLGSRGAGALPGGMGGDPRNAWGGWKGNI